MLLEKQCNNQYKAQHQGNKLNNYRKIFLIINYFCFFLFYRLVYKWFYFIYRLSYVLGIIGYCIAMATFVGLNLVFDVKPQVWMDCCLLLLYYGLYFGVLGRDVAEICADKMASHIGVSIFI